MIKFLKPRCEKCAHYKSQHCILQNIIPNPTALCSNYTESPYICEICGKHLISSEVIWTYGNEISHHMICGNCINLINTCGSCKQAQDCRFEQDHTISEPAYVIEQIRQGPAIMQQQIKNPKRINLTCATGCPCYINGECVKSDGNSCEKYVCIVKNW